MVELQQKMMRLRLLGLMFSTTPIVFVGVSFAVAPLQPAPEAGSLDMMLPVFSVVALMTLVAIPIVRRMLRGSATLGPAGITHGLTPLEAAETSKEMELALEVVSKCTMIGFAMSESVVIYGFMVAFLFADPLYSLPFAAVGWLAMALQWPRASMVERLMSDRARTTLMAG
jgi:F0F1-type ATP synthase membrane subunit c/vacuolar-type H+-ATPase subunit K